MPNGWRLLDWPPPPTEDLLEVATKWGGLKENR